MKKIEIYILPLLCCSQYLVYHLFGINNYYSYPTFNKISIFLNSVYIFILFFFLSQIFYFFLFKTPKKYFIFFNTLGLSIFAFLSISLLFRYADINYGFILESTFGDIIQKTIYLFIFLTLFCLILLTNKKTNFNFYKFFFYLLIIISLLLYFRLYNLHIHVNTKNDYKNFVNDHQIDQKEKKAILVIFDEFDYNILEKNLYKFPNLKKFVNTSFYHNNFYSNQNTTLKSIPEILTGFYNKKTKYHKGKMAFENQSGKLIYYNHENSIFNDLNKRGLKSDIYGQWHPYCKTFNVQQCYDVNNFKLSEISFLYSLELLMNQFYLNSFGIDTRKIRRNLETFIFKNFKIKKKIDTENTSILEFKNINFLNELAYNQFRYTKDFVNSSGDFIFIHYPYPHPPVHILPNKDIKNKFDEDYLLNLFLVDKTIELIISSLDKFKNDQVLLIITSDHWLRDAYEEKLGKQKIFFASKILGDNENFSINIKQNLTTVKDLVLDFFDNKINNNNDILNYFSNKHDNN